MRIFFGFIISLFCGFNLYAKDVRILFLGDSLTEGFGVQPEQAYPVLVQQKFSKNANHINCFNAGISGSTSQSGVSRLKWHLKSTPKFDIVFIALGANDGLRGLSTSNLEKNLQETVDLAKQNNMKVVLAGIRMPQNYGKKFTEEFYGTFKNVTAKNKLLFLPFLLLNVAAEPSKNIKDGIHPNVEGHKIIAQTVYDFFVAHQKELGI